MKTLWPLLFILFVAVNVSAADFLDDFTGYGVKMRQSLGISGSATGMLDDTTANNFVREAIVTLSPLIKPRKATTTIITTYRQNAYSLDTLVSGIIAVEWSKNDSVKSLVYVPRNLWYEQYSKVTKDKKDPYQQRPSYYDFIDGTIYLYPVPSAVRGDTIKIMGWEKLPNFISADTLEIIPLIYRVAILKYAVYLAARARSNPMTPMYLRDYEQAIAILRGEYGTTPTQ